MKQPTPVYVSFYANNRRLGGSWVKEGSDRPERDRAARKIGILNYNRVIFENRSPKIDISDKILKKSSRSIRHYLFSLPPIISVEQPIVIGSSRIVNID
jgi:hypothetical protein